MNLVASIIENFKFNKIASILLLGFSMLLYFAHSISDLFKTIRQKLYYFISCILGENLTAYNENLYWGAGANGDVQ